MTEFEDRRLDQLAFAAEEAEDEYRRAQANVPPERRAELRAAMKTVRQALDRFIVDMT